MPLLHSYLMAGTVWVREHKTRTNDIKSGINVHRVRILKGYYMHSIVWCKMSCHPFNAHVVCNLKTGQSKFH